MKKAPCRLHPAWLLLLSLVFSIPGHAADVDADNAWKEYNRLIEATRQTMLARKEAQDPQVRAQALYGLQSMQSGAFRFIVAPRQDYPAFYRESIWSPFESTWGGPASDFVYQWTFLDGARTYRIKGKRGTTRFVDFQLWNGYWTTDQRGLGNYDLDKFSIDKDGSFEIILSPKPHGGNWIQLDPEAHDIVIQVRDVFYDWGKEQRVRMSIEALDRPADTMALSEAEINHRLVKAGQLVQTGIGKALGFYDEVMKAAGGSNRFLAMKGGDGKHQGASPRAGYYPIDFELQPDEALILETDVPQAKYWSIQLTDLWWQTLDFSYHQSGLNGHQARIDSDGKFRAVIALHDPGVPNWIDTVGTRIGQGMMRTYDGSLVAVPTVRRVKLREVRSYLPADTPVIDAMERKRQISLRARESLHRWGE
jgi:hypothetical protein